MHVFRNGGVRLITLISNPQMRVNELGPPDFRSNARFEKPVTFTLTLPSSMNVYNVREGKLLGSKHELTVDLNPYEPTILAVTQTALPKLHVLAPAEVKRGSTANIGLSCPETAAAAMLFAWTFWIPMGIRCLSIQKTSLPSTEAPSSDCHLR